MKKIGFIFLLFVQINIQLYSQTSTQVIIGNNVLKYSFSEKELGHVTVTDFSSLKTDTILTLWKGNTLAQIISNDSLIVIMTVGIYENWFVVLKIKDSQIISKFILKGNQVRPELPGSIPNNIIIRSKGKYKFLDINSFKCIERIASPPAYNQLEFEVLYSINYQNRMVTEISRTKIE